MTNDLLVSIGAILPVTVLVIWASLLLLVDLFIPKDRENGKPRTSITVFLAALGLIASAGFVIARIGRPVAGFGGMVVVDDFANFISLLLLASGLVGIALSFDYLKRIEIERGEYYVLLLFSISGMMLMTMSADLIMVFLALELLSIPLYVLAGIALPRASSEEAAIKYFLLGAFSSGFLVYGIALVYGASGSTSLKEIVAVIQANQYNAALMVSGAALILVGLGFKVAVVPFHMWTPDVYQGAPSAVTAFMAVGAKAAGFAALLRVFVLAFPALSIDIAPVLWGLAALTMILGNVVAIAQRNIKRLLAYSSIAHAGYILMALVPYGQGTISADTVGSALFYLVAYAFTNFAAWSVVIALERAGESGLDLDDYAGMGRKYPALAAVMAVAMLSFTGVPPTLGFVGKFFLFRTVVEGGYIGLALIGVLTSLVSAYYYLRVVVIMYMRDGEPEARREPWLQLMAYGSGIGVVILSIFSAPLLYLATQAALKLF
jgi:NADH-quinone oxidoreductase subunit N